MSQHFVRYRALAVAAPLLMFALGACSKSSSPTAPYGGGGGGGGGGGTSGMPFSLGPFALGQSASLAFPNAGTFGYHCIAHQNMGMVGTVQVDAGGLDSEVVQIGASGFAFTPQAAHIKPGAHVRWVNASTLTNHTVTSN